MRVHKARPKDVLNWEVPPSHPMDMDALTNMEAPQILFKRFSGVLPLIQPNQPPFPESESFSVMSDSF